MFSTIVRVVLILVVAALSWEGMSLGANLMNQPSDVAVVLGGITGFLAVALGVVAIVYILNKGDF